MAIEVEQKFPLANRRALEQQLAELGHFNANSQSQVDTYFAPPNRDFAQTDEAFRIRREGERNFLTYKGPKIDATTKSRREIEIALADGARSATDTASLFEALGFQRVADVRKRRVHSTLSWEGREIDVALDEIEGLGDFVELEIVVEETEVDAARDCLASLARRLGLSASERRSYLELLLAASNQKRGN